uniref:Mediator of RNA polymerase II transcription subunit 15 n=1 Tax=Timema genevievae TaxID=629358 RepID=A0A7R9JVQ5_TIMGE|nr:unnamed protein product [Timema genevievae]
MTSEENSWRTTTFRQSVVAKIDEAIQRSGMPTTKNSNEMENHVFQKAKTKLCVSLILLTLHLSLQASPPIGQPSPFPSAVFVPHSQPDISPSCNGRPPLPTRHISLLRRSSPDPTYLPPSFTIFRLAKPFPFGGVRPSLST